MVKRKSYGFVLFPHAEAQVALISIAIYVGMGLMLTGLPNPMLKDAILALNMTVIVIAGGVAGPRAGLATGFFGTALTYLFKLMMGHSDMFEFYAILPHAAMGGVAGLIAQSGASRIAVAATILVGHTLNLLAFFIYRLFDRSLLRNGHFWNGLLAEIALDILLIAFVLGVVQYWQGRRSYERWEHRQRIGMILAALMTALLLIAHVQGLALAPYLFFLPVILAAAMIGPLAPFLFAALLSVPLIARVVALGVESTKVETSLVISLNLSALAVGELVERWRNERHLAEARLRKLQHAYALLAETERLKQEIIQNVSHELRTPLTLLLGHLELLADGGYAVLSPAQRHSLEKALIYAHKLTQLVEQITVLQQLSDGVMSYQRVQLSPLVRKVVARYEIPALQQGCELVCRCEAEADLSVTGDPILLEQAIAALLDNAVKFSPHGGEIVVRLWREGERLYCTVSDHGIGIAEDEQEKVFRRFYQINGTMTRRYSGIGIGLAIVREVITASGGDVWLESRPGEGTTIGFWLPLSPLPAVERKNAPLQLQEV